MHVSLFSSVASPKREEHCEWSMFFHIFFFTISTSTSSSSSLRKWEWLRLHIKHTLHIIPSQHVKTNPLIPLIEFEKEKERKNAPTEQKGSCSTHGAATADLLNLKKYKKDDDGEDVHAKITQVVVGSTLARICDMWYFPISFHKYYNNINVPRIEYFCDVNISQRGCRCHQAESFQSIHSTVMTYLFPSYLGPLIFGWVFLHFFLSDPVRHFRTQVFVEVYLNTHRIFKLI